MISTNFKLRIKALFIDYFYIALYLLILYAITMGIYFIFFDSIPEFTEETSQWIAFLTTVLPVTIYYTFKESGKSFASLGKEKGSILKIILNQVLKKQEYN